MNEVFEGKRFGKYFVTDLRNSWNNVGLSLVILCSTPLICTIVCGLWSMVISDTHHWTSIPIAVRASILAIAVFVMTISLASKLYGHITEKKQGTLFLMVPASSFEKSLSMILVTVLVEFVAFFVGYLSLDAIICAIDTNCGGSLISSFSTIIQMTGNELFDDFSMKNYGIVLFILEYLSTVFAFLLGAIFFKKSKAGKTILSLLGLSCVLGLIASAVIPAIVKNADIHLKLTEEMVKHSAVTIANLSIAISVLYGLALCVLIFFRVKTLKH